MAKERIKDDQAAESTRGRGATASGSGGRGEARGSRTKHSKGRGRSLIAVLLIGFVLVASTVIWRRTYGITLARTLSDLGRQRSQLESERARLANVIRDESSRSRLVRVVEERGMHVPSDQQVRIFPR